MMLSWSCGAGSCGGPAPPAAAATGATCSSPSRGMAARAGSSAPAMAPPASDTACCSCASWDDTTHKRELASPQCEAAGCRRILAESRQVLVPRSQKHAPSRHARGQHLCSSILKPKISRAPALFNRPRPTSRVKKSWHLLPGRPHTGPVPQRRVHRRGRGAGAARRRQPLRDVLRQRHRQHVRRARRGHVPHGCLPRLHTCIQPAPERSPTFPGAACADRLSLAWLCCRVASPCMLQLHVAQCRSGA